MGDTPPCGVASQLDSPINHQLLLAQLRMLRVWALLGIQPDLTPPINDQFTMNSLRIGEFTVASTINHGINMCITY